MTNNNSTTIRALRETPLLCDIGRVVFVRYWEKPIKANYTPDIFHPYKCPYTGLSFEWCYHSSGDCYELRDEQKTFWVAFRFIEWEDDDWAWEATIFIDNLGGDPQNILTYATIFKLLGIQPEYDSYSIRIPIL